MTEKTPTQAENDTVAHEIAAKVIDAKVGTSECASLTTANLSDGNRYLIIRFDTYEADLKNRQKRGLEQAAVIADQLGGVRGPHDAVSPANKAQHVRAKSIAQAIRAAKEQ
jgi:hypothetical protein